MKSYILLHAFTLMVFYQLSVMCSSSASLPGGGQYRFNVLLANHDLEGTLSMQVSAPGAPTQNGLLNVSVGSDGVLTGTLSLADVTYTVEGKRTTSPSRLTARFTALNGSTRLNFSGRLQDDLFIGRCSGPRGGPLATKSSFSIDAGSLPPLAAKIVTSLSAGSRGILSGSGTASMRGNTEEVLVSGQLIEGPIDPRRGAVRKAPSCQLSIKGQSFGWSGRGQVLEDGFVFAWKAKGPGVSAAGKVLDVKSTDAESGDSSGSLSIKEEVLRAIQSRTTTIEVDVADAVLTPIKDEVEVRINSVNVPSSALRFRGGGFTINSLLLSEGRNSLVVNAKDEKGRSLNGEFTLWAGSKTLIVNIVDAQNQSVQGVSVEVVLGDDANIKLKGVSDAGGQVRFINVPDRTMSIAALASNGLFANTPVTGAAGVVRVQLKDFNTASPIDNNDFAGGTLSGWQVSSSASIVTNNPTDGSLSASALRYAISASSNNWDMKLVTIGEGPQSASRTAVLSPGAKALKIRYRFVTSEVPGGYFGSKYNDYFSITLRTKAGGGFVSDGSTMNALGLAAFDPQGRTAWREVSLPISDSGDTFQADITVANVGDGAYDSYILIDKVEIVNIDLSVLKSKVSLLDANTIQVKMEPSNQATSFKIEAARLGDSTWYQIGNQQTLSNYVHRVAGTFNVRGKATISGTEYTTPTHKVEVAFPLASEIIADSSCVTEFDSAWAETKSTTTSTQRRETAFWVRLDTSAAQGAYQFAGRVYGPWVPGTTNASVTPAPKPGDTPSNPSANAAGAVYTVALFHTHTPTFYRPIGRDVGPSPADVSYANANKVPIFAYDYIPPIIGPRGSITYIPAGYPIHRAAKVWSAGPTRRPTP
jgi:hypothetical protein